MLERVRQNYKASTTMPKKISKKLALSNEQDESVSWGREGTDGSGASGSLMWGPALHRECLKGSLFCIVISPGIHSLNKPPLLPSSHR